MKRLTTLFCGAVLVMVAASDGSAMDATIRQSDMGAGPIVAKVTACLVANRSHRGASCPEPDISQAPDNAKRVANRLERAWCFIDMQDFDKARAEIGLALGIDPAELQARHLSLGWRWRSAICRGPKPIWRSRANRRPTDPDIHATYAVTLESKPADLEALRELCGHSKISRTCLRAQEAAHLLMKFGHYQVALQNLNVVVERRPTVNVLVQRSETFLALGKPQSAAADLSAALKLEPNQFMLTIARVDAYAAAGLGELALRDYDSVLPLHVMFDNDRAKLLAKRANGAACRRFCAHKSCCAGMALPMCRSTVTIRRSCVRRLRRASGSTSVSRASCA
jgi:tetratricopeptide (TPR) repeat protein